MNNTKTVHPPSLNIMGGANSNPSLSIVPDTLSISMNLQSSESQLFNHCKRKKERLQESDTLTEEILDVKTDTGLYWNLQRTGVSKYPYVLKTGDITLLISARQASSPMPSASLNIGSVSCQNGASEMIEKVSRWLNEQQIFVVKNVVSRADLCLDLLGHDIKNGQVRLFDEDYYICKAVKYAQFREHRKITGVQIGRGSILLRMYDKILELKKPENSEKFEFFKKKWGQNPEFCTRVEFQLRRLALKEILRDGNYQEFLSKMDEIWNYLTNDWFRHARQAVDRDNNNQSKVGTSQIWKEVQSASSSKDKIKRVAVKHIQKSMKQLTAQMRGLLVTIIAGLGVDDLKKPLERTTREEDEKRYWRVVETVAHIAQEEIRKVMDSKDWKTILRTRQKNTVLVYDELKGDKYIEPDMFGLMPEYKPTPSLF